MDKPQPSLDAEKPVRRVQLFRAGSFQFGVFEKDVAAIAEWREPTPLPHAPESVLGVVSIQGRMLTVLDLEMLAGNEIIPGASSYRHIIVLRGDEQLALAVSHLAETIEHLDSDSENSADTHERFVSEVLLHAGSTVKILNLTELFPAALQGRERRRRRF